MKGNELSTLIELIRKYNKTGDLSMVEKAYNFAVEKHDGQTRKSGEPFVNHPIQVASIIAEMEFDVESIVAALLHDVVEDTDSTREDIVREFGETVALLVDGVTKLDKIPYSSKEEQQIETLRKMFFAMAEDVRVIVIKLADRLHNMRTMNCMPEQKRRDKSLENMQVFAPIAHRLGIKTIKDELEDRSLQYLDPIGYKEIEDDLLMTEEGRDKFIESIKNQILAKTEGTIPGVYISGRVKSINSIYRKTYMQGKTMDQIFDIFAVRVIVDTVSDCYNVLGVVHDIFKPIPNRFKDYISMPKPNMYQSLHTTVLSKDGVPFEIQIRTWDMHRTAEYGIAAHWKYKLGKGGKDSIDDRLQWIHKMLETGEESTDAEDLVRNIKGDLSSDEIFVFTPKGDVKSLPSGATVIDFAYAIHSAVGNKMTGAKVNGRIVPINYKLKTGEICEIITSNQPGKGPSRDWLKIVTTGEARSKIRSWFKKEKREENILEGRSEVERELRRNFIRLEGEQYSAFLKKIAERQHCASIEDFYATIGYGGLVMSRLMPGIKDEYNRNWRQKDEQTAHAVVQQQPPKPIKGSGGIIVEGIDNCLIKMSKCCSPIPGEEIIGFITRGHGLSIHRRDCVNVPKDIEHCPEPERWVKAYWDKDVEVEAKSTLEVYAIDRDGLVLDITAALAKAHVKIHSINARPINEGNCLTTLTLTVNSREHLENVIKIIRKIDNVYQIERVAGK